MTEQLSPSRIRGARSVHSLARASLSYNISRRGADALLGYPDTEYELPVAFGQTDLKVTTLGGASLILDWTEGLLRNTPTRENALDAGAARLSGKLEELSQWRVLVGPQESSALPAYLRRLPPAAFAAAHE